MFNINHGREGLPLVLVNKDEYDAWFKQQPEFVCNWLVHSGFKGVGHCLIPATDGNVSCVLIVTEDKHSIWSLADVSIELPVASYYLEGDAMLQRNAGLGWVLGQYQFSRYKDGAERAMLYLSDAQSVSWIEAMGAGVCIVRDLVNTPAEDMMPEHLSERMHQLANQYGATFNEIVGDELLEENYPTIHMVGRASEHEPRLLDMVWGDENHPNLTLVGKGVCFDSGGMDIKPAIGMRLMKKDMGGAAHALGLAALIMAFKLPVRLRVLVPAVENAVAGNAFRPGDIVKTRKGLTVEIDNTDAEGRLVLCDALAEADAESPDLIIDFATLTGAARVALGLELPGFYSTDEQFAAQMMSGAEQAEDLVWRLPLHQPYADYMQGTISDLVNSSPTPMGGSITAALYLQAFVEQSSWVHFDVGAWNDRPRPGRPKGGEAMGIRAVFAALQARYAAQAN
ncbi:MAG: leucyl aminopeptidase family protein [Reinekea sp.]